MVVAATVCLNFPAEAESSNLVTVSTAGNTSYHETMELYENLLISYEPRLKSRNDQSQNVYVSVEFSLLNVIGFDTASQKLELLGKVAMRWHDKIISWNASQYDGIDTQELPISKVWTPALLMGSGFDILTKVDAKEGTLFYNSTGNAEWVAIGILSALCEVDAKYFPYDKQSCNIAVCTRNAY